MRKVASRDSQHSWMLGQPASWQTVCREAPATFFFMSSYSGPVFTALRIHRGFVSIGVCAFRFSTRSSLRPSGAIVTPSPYSQNK